MRWYDYLALIVFVCVLLILSGCKSQTVTQSEGRVQLDGFFHALDTLRFSDCTVTTITYPAIHDTIRVRDTIIIKQVRTGAAVRQVITHDTIRQTNTQNTIVKHERPSKSKSVWTSRLKMMSFFLVLVLFLILGARWYFLYHVKN